MAINEKHKLNEKMLEEYAYPEPEQDDFQSSIYRKREFYIHTIPPREKIENYEQLQNYREKTCSRSKLLDTQILLSNFISPNTPYHGLLIFHGTGVGKTGSAIAIGEGFKPMVEKYGNRIYVLVSGPYHKQNFIQEILKFTGESYYKLFYDKPINTLNSADQEKLKKNAINIIMQYYRIMSYRSFYKKVLGEKVKEKVISGEKVYTVNRRTESGEIERDLSIDRIYNLDNTLLIIDEAHNLTGNEYGHAVKKIIESSKNLKVILLTATPMINTADEIVELINYLRPLSYPMERSKIFNSQYDYLMDFKEGGRENLRKMVRGYVSFLRGSDPLVFAERIDNGEIPPGLLFTKLMRCYMYPFQLKTYLDVIQIRDDSLERKSQSVANFVFPGLSKDKKEIIGFYGIEGMNEVKTQLKYHNQLINQKIANEILKNEKVNDPSELLYLVDNDKNINGNIFHEKYLKYFSIKYYSALQSINNNVYGKKGNGLVFVYSNLVKVGIEIFQIILQKNGYLEYQENPSNYYLQNDTRCYFCDHTYGNHQLLSENIPHHSFQPATYIVITGKTEEAIEQIPEEKFKIIKNVFNHPDNKDGKNIKIIIGSKVINEGITLYNIKEVHILDFHFVLGKVDQVIGRAIRFCTHYALSSKENPYPKVEINKYVISLTNELSTEEQLYQKSELKYKLIKETERILQEEAIDCPLNYNGNIFPEEVKKYADCGSPDNLCPSVCGYMKCEYKCGDKLLNAKYYDPERHIYKKIEKENLDYTTYDILLATDEIEYSKEKIKEMYRLEHIYLLDDIIEYVKDSFPTEKKQMFDDFYVFQALDQLIPLTENDFNNFHDIIIDKFGRMGYLIYRHIYYIFQPFDEIESLPMYYRRHYRPKIYNSLSLKDYIYGTTDYKKFKEKYKSELGEEAIPLLSTKKYDFDSVQEYYDSREEFKYVGIIDQESLRKKIKRPEEIKDEFKIRERRPKVLVKKRETGVPSFKGAVCHTSKDRRFLLKIIKELHLNEMIKNESRIDICDLIRDKLYDMEKYSTSKDKNKMTYLIIPANHPIIPFPLNLEDRIKRMIKDIQNGTYTSIEPTIHVKKEKGRFPDIKYVSYELIYDKSMNAHSDVIKKYSAINKDNKWIITLS